MNQQLSVKQWIELEGHKAGATYLKLYPEEGITPSVVWANVKKRWPEAFLAEIPRGKVWGRPPAVLGFDDCLLGDVSDEHGRSPDRHTFFEKPHLAWQKIPGRVVVAGAAGTGYFHWMLGVLPRVHLALKAGVDSKSVDKWIINKDDTDYAKESFRILGIPWDKTWPVSRDLSIDVENLLVPSLGWYKGSLPGWVKEFLGETFSGSTQYVDCGRRLYISREDAGSRRIVNEKEVMSLLQSFGFEKIILSGRPVTEQAMLFSSADAVIGPHGGGLTNIIFCHSGAKVLELIAQGHNNNCFEVVGSRSQVVYHRLLCQPSQSGALEISREDIFVDLVLLEQALKRAGMDK